MKIFQTSIISNYENFCFYIVTENNPNLRKAGNELVFLKSGETASKFFEYSNKEKFVAAIKRYVAKGGHFINGDKDLQDVLDRLENSINNNL